MKREDVTKAAKAIGPWIPAILLVLIFAKQGWSKFNDASGWSQAFRHWGYPDWFRMSVGVAELVACALLLSGRGAALGGLLIVGVMLGGTATHVVLDQGRNVTSEIVPIVLGTLVVLLRRQQLTQITTALRIERKWAALAVAAFILVAVITPAILPVPKP